MAKKPGSTGNQGGATRFKKGQSGNPAGRKPGSRNKLSEDFISVLASHFEKHGKAAVERLLKEDPAAYVKVVASLVPKDMNVNMNASQAFIGLWQAISAGAVK